MSTKGVVFLTLLAVSFLLIPTVADKRTCNSGSIVPVSPYFLETQDIILECSSHNEASSLAFFIGTDTEPVNETFIIVRNDTYIKLKIPNITVEVVKDYKVQKLVRCVDLDSGVCMDNVFVKLEYYPTNVKDIDCIVDNFKTLSCDWDVGVAYKVEGNVNISSFFIFHLTSFYSTNKSYDLSQWMSCPNGNRTSCFFSQNDLPPFAKLEVLVTVSNLEQNITMYTQKVFLRADIVKPSPIQSLSFNLTRNPACVLLSWDGISCIQPILHNITYQSICDKTTNVQITKNCSHKVCGLNPYTKYNVEVVSRYFPDDEEKGHWSAPAKIVFMSAKSIPKRSPLITDGLYVYNKDRIRIYWQPLTECETHSDDTVYKVSIQGSTKWCNKSMDFQTEILLSDKEQSADSFNVTIITKNRIGKAEVKTLLEINAQTKVPKDSELIVEYKRDGKNPQYIGRIVIYNETRKDYHNITHTLTWCRGESSTGCQEPMQWLEIQDVNKTGGIKIPVADSSAKHLFGLITKGYNKADNTLVSTDINTIQCIYEYNTVLEKPLTNVNLAKFNQPGSLTVHWDNYKCEKFISHFERGSFVENYVVTICEAKERAENSLCLCENTETVIPVPRELTSYTVDNLTPGVAYCIWVAAQNSVGLGPKNSNSLLHTVTSEGTNSQSWMVYVLIGVILITVISAVVVIKCTNLDKRLKIWCSTMFRPPIQDPEVFAEAIELSDRNTHRDPPQVTSGLYVDESTLYVIDNGNTGMGGHNSRTPLLGYETLDNIGSVHSDSSVDNVSVNSLLSDVQETKNIEGNTVHIDDTDSFDSAIRDDVSGSRTNRHSRDKDNYGGVKSESLNGEVTVNAAEGQCIDPSNGNYKSTTLDHKQEESSGIISHILHESAVSERENDNEYNFTVNKPIAFNDTNISADKDDHVDNISDMYSDYDLSVTTERHLEGYQYVPLTESDSDDDSAVEPNDGGDSLAYRESQAECNISTNKLSSLESGGSTSTASSKDSAVCLSGDTTESSDKDCLTSGDQLCTTTGSNDHYCNTTDSCTCRSHPSKSHPSKSADLCVQTSHYAGTDDIVMTSDKSESHLRTENGNIKEIPKDLKEGYSCATLIKI